MVYYLLLKLNMENILSMSQVILGLYGHQMAVIKADGLMAETFPVFTLKKIEGYL